MEVVGKKNSQGRELDFAKCKWFRNLILNILTSIKGNLIRKFTLSYLLIVGVLPHTQRVSA